MKTVSNTYKKDMNKVIRNHSYCTITFGNIDITAVTDGAWDEDNGHLSWSNISTLDYEHDYADCVITLELNRWRLDGNQTILDGQNDGWVSSIISDADGKIDAYISREFQDCHALSGMTISWDKESFPIEATVKYLQNEVYEPLITEHGNSLITHIDDFLCSFGKAELTGTTFYPNSTTTIVSLTDEPAKSILLAFSCVLPYTRPHMHQTLWGIGIIFNNDDISSVSMSHDVDPLSRRLPDEKLKFTIFDYEHKFDPENIHGAYATINTGAPLKIQYQYELDDGTIESLKPDIYILQNKPTHENNMVTFEGCGLIGYLKGTYYKSQRGNKNFYDMANAVLLDAGLTPTAGGNNPWEIDQSLKQMYTGAVLPVQSHMECLQQIAHACRCRLFTDDDNIIHIRPFGANPVEIFDGDYSDNGHAYWSEWGTVDYGSDDNDTYATLELNRWQLGEPLALIPTDPYFYDKEGYVSGMSNAQGKSTSVWERSYDVTHDLPIIHMEFDNILNEFPVELKIQYYDADGNEVGTAVYCNPDEVTATITAENREDIKLIKVSMQRTLPHYRSRLHKVAYRETDFTLTFDSIDESSHKTTILDKVRNVYVNQYSYTYDDSAKEIFSCTTTDTALHAEYPMSKDITVTVTGGTAVKQIYAQACDMVLTPTEEGGTMSVSITGKSAKENTFTKGIAVNQEGEDDYEENHLITNEAMANALGDHVSTYLSFRNTYDDSYRGNPELETGDIIELETTYSKALYGIILTDEITFNGGIRGKVKVKGLV